MKNSAIVVHGGAAPWQISDKAMRNVMAACIAAAEAGQAILVAGGSALDAVEAAVHILEDCPEMDAGRGSHPNTLGQVEMDALIMDGADLSMGAIAAVQRVRYPISLARKVMEIGNHNFLVGAGAELFADSIGFPRCKTADLLVNHPPSEQQPELMVGDTVGAVAFDLQGNLASATSTGGVRDQLPGRVGDSPMIGSGGYADNRTAAVGATGVGEDLMKVVISKQVSDFVAIGMAAPEACYAAIRLLEDRVNGKGGLIAIDAAGHVGIAFNTSAMPHALAIGEGPIRSGR